MANQGSNALDYWKANADFWDNGVGFEGNEYWKVLQRPCLERLVKFKPGCRALDLATGNGLVARWLAEGGAEVVATDGSKEMLEHAIRRTPGDYKDHIFYEYLDVTSTADFEAFAKSPLAADGFDIVTINMTIMDIPTLEPLAKAVPNLLKQEGVFVATMLHPVFVTSKATRHLEFVEGQTTTERGVIRTYNIRDYLHVPPWQGFAISGQPELQWYFHRPLHELFSTFFQAGLVMDALEEPAFTDASRSDERVEARSNYTQIPPILAFRLRKRH